jgi:hypothetical protein
MVYFQLLYLMPPGYALFSRSELGYTCSGIKGLKKMLPEQAGVSFQEINKERYFPLIRFREGNVIS